MSKNDIYNYTLKDLKELFKKVGKEKYRSLQIYRWLYNKTVTDFSLMTDLNKDFRKFLNDNFIIGSLTNIKNYKSVDGSIKYLFKTIDGYFIESVFIPHDDRLTVCLSSQIGCRMNCQFCATAKLKFIRNLSLSEIVEQMVIIENDLKKEGKSITNVVFMGMGEPLLNIENVLKASEIFSDAYAFCLAKHKITLSTCGIADMIPELGKYKYKLAVSLNSADDKIRNKIMPINKKYSLNILKKSIKQYYQNAGRNFVSFEYIMFKDINTSDEEIDKLIKFVKSIGWLAKVNLITYNNTENNGFENLNDAGIDRVFRRLNDSGIRTTVRNSKGSDISAACGQLAGKQEKL